MKWEKDISLVTVFDSKTGKIYVASKGEGWLFHDPVKTASPITTRYVFFPDKK